MTTSAYTHNGDREFMQKLGLEVDGFEDDWTDLGTVTVDEAGEDDVDATGTPVPRQIDATVKVEVSAMRAQFWRFTVTRPSELLPGVAESYEITTGSGGFQRYWPSAVLIAENCLNVKPTMKLRVDPTREEPMDIRSMST